MFGRVLAISVLAASSANAAAADPKQPTGKWIVDFADAQCVATRNYGSDADPLYLVLKTPATGGAVQVGVVRKSSKTGATQIDGEIIFDEAVTVRTSLLEFGNKKMGQRAMLANLPAKDVAPLRQASSIRIRAREDGISRLGTRLATNVSKAEESFAVTQMPALMTTLDRCAADLRKIWRVWDDEKGSEGLKEGPTANLSNLFSAEDYPAIAIVQGDMGSVAFVLLIDEQGKVADCTVTETSGLASLDAQSCAIVKERGKFKPAIGLDGKPAKSSYFQRITWRIQG